MKVILVTGATRGIGYETARQLAAAGNTVVFGCRNPHYLSGDKLLLNYKAYIYPLDVTNESMVHGICDFIAQEFGHLDVLINNAGIGEAGNSTKTGIRKSVKKTPILRNVYNLLKPVVKKVVSYRPDFGLQRASIEKSKEIMDTNFYGVWRMCQAAIPLLQKSSDAQIINVSSGMGLLSNLSGYLPAYSLSKASLNAYSIMLANELEIKNIAVNAVCPGWVRTELGGPDAPLSVAEGVDTIVWLAQRNSRETGKFYKKRQILDW